MSVRRDHAAPGWRCAACVFIESNVADLVSVDDDVASAVAMAPEDLVPDFHHHLGFTPADLLDDVRSTGPLSIGR